LPVAQTYLRTGNRRWARKWYALFHAWRRAFPPMGMPVGRPEETAFIWYDMQVTTRLLVLMNSIFLLASRRRTPFAASQWREIYASVMSHARWVRAEAATQLGEGAGGNHFLQKGMALICVAALFPEAKASPEWMSIGRQVVISQMQNEVKPDGGSVEGSPSYSHFIAGMYLAAYLILKNNRLPPIPGLERSIRDQYRFLEATMTPSGRTLQIGDSYSMDARSDLAAVRRLFELPPSPVRKSRCFPDSRLVILRSSDTDVYLDAMDVRFGHAHPGKPNILVYHRGQPVIVDCGIVDYDDPAPAALRDMDGAQCGLPRFLRRYSQGWT
jgi:hypothetical protein